jgi:flagellar biosynthesis GTPase FlhF
MTEQSTGGSEPLRFVGRTPREAIAQVRAALGRDAVILEQHQRDGQVEIIASRDFPAAFTPPAARAAAREREALEARLAALGFEAGFAERLPGAAGGADPATLAARTVRCAELPSPLTGALRFIGPPGAGKTTTIIKLLAERVLRYGSRGLLLVSTDDRRLAGCEQLALAAELLEVGYRECADHEVDAVLSEHRDKSLVLVDTAGISSGQSGSAAASTTDLLVVPAVWQPGALRRFRTQLGERALAGAVLTHVDQADLLGPALSVLAGWNLPLYWVSRGPELPDDLERATPELIAELVSGGVDRSGLRTTFPYGA